MQAQQARHDAYMASEQGQQLGRRQGFPWPLSALAAAVQGGLQAIRSALALIPAVAASMRLKSLKQAYMESGQLDLAAKAAYLKELNKSDPAAVLRHMEQQPQLASEAVAAEYIRALVKSGRIDEYTAGTATDAARSGEPLPQLLGNLQKLASGAAASPPEAGGTRSRPLHVVVQAPEAEKVPLLLRAVRYVLGVMTWLLIGSVLYRGVCRCAARGAG
jgi:hypothetical protein